MRFKINHKIQALTILLLLVTGVSFFIISYLKTKETVQKEVILRMQNMSDRALDITDRFIYERLLDLNELNTALKNVNDSVVKHNTIESYINKSPFFDAYAIYQEDRTCIFNSFDPNCTGHKEKLKRFWVDLHFKGQAFDITPSKNENRLLFCKTIPTASGEKNHIILYASYNSLFQIFHESFNRIQEHIDVHLIDRSGHILFSNTQNKGISKGFSIHPDYKEIIKKINHTPFETFHSETLDNTVRLISMEKGFLNFSGNNWLLIFDAKDSYIFSSLSLLTKQLGINILIILIVVIILSAIVSKSISNPIKKLSKLSTIYGEGHLTHKIDFRTNDELQELHNNMQFMAVQLHDKIEVLNTLNQRLHEQINDVEAKSKIIYNKNLMIDSSMRYAKHMQEIILKPQLDCNCSSFQFDVINTPLSVVGGDYYYHKTFCSEQEETSIWAVFDCTGHGVPGAFITLISHNIFKRIIKANHHLSPSEVLEIFDRELKITLHQNNGNAKLNDSIDVGLVIHRKNKNCFEYAGARRPILYTNGNAIHIIKGTRRSVGGKESNKHNFETHRILLSNNDRFFLFSDGVTDQFNTTNTTKYSTAQLISHIKVSLEQPIKEQLYFLKTQLLTWQGNTPQTDDIILLGVHFTVPLPQFTKPNCFTELLSQC